METFEELLSEREELISFIGDMSDYIIECEGDEEFDDVLLELLVERLKGLRYYKDKLCDLIDYIDSIESKKNSKKYKEYLKTKERLVAIMRVLRGDDKDSPIAKYISVKSLARERDMLRLRLSRLKSELDI